MCVVKDALIPLLSALKLTDIWVLASPIYFDGFCGQMKLLLDRCHHFIYRDGKRAPQLTGKRRAAIIVTYEVEQCEDYLKVAEVQAGYLGWMGDFGEVKIIAEGELNEADAASNRPDLLKITEELGRKLVEELESKKRNT
jgi:multimeric flavodoxin WrbA